MCSSSALVSDSFAEVPLLLLYIYAGWKVRVFVVWFVWLQPKWSLCTLAQMRSWRQSFGRRRKNNFIAFPGKTGHSRLMFQNRAQPWEGIVKGFIGLAQRHSYQLMCLYYSPSIDSFRVIKSGINWSGDGFWFSSGLSFLDIFSVKKIANRWRRVRKCFNYKRKF